MSSTYSFDLIKQLAADLAEDGFTSEEITSFRTRGRLREFRGVIRGTHEIRAMIPTRIPLTGTEPVSPAKSGVEEFEATPESGPVYMIDLSVPCKLPFKGAERISPAKSGVVKLERRGEDLVLDGKKIELLLSEKQKGEGRVIGHDLHKELDQKKVGQCGGSVLDHLVAHPELWPESWKKDAQGNTVYVFFWGDIFQAPGGYLYVRCGHWSAGKVVAGSRWLGHNWESCHPAAAARAS